MPLELNTVIAPAPTTTRGQPLSVGAYAKKSSIVYGNGLMVYARNVEKPGEVMVVHRHKQPVTTARVSPSQCYCASGDKEGNVVVWALDNEQHTVKLEGSVLSGPICDIAWTGDNQRIVIVGEGKEQRGAALMVDGGSTVGSIGGHTRTILSADVRTERPFRAATGSEDSEVNFFEGPPYKFKHGQKHHSNNVNCVRFSPSGDKFLTVSSDKTILVYDGKTGEKTGQIPCDHTGSVYSVSWHPSGKHFITSSADKSVKLYDEAGAVKQTFKLQDKSVDYMQVGCVYVGEHPCSVGLNGDVNVFTHEKDTPTTVLRGHMKPITALAVEGNTVVSCSGDPSVLVWDDKAHDPTKSRRPVAKKMHASLISGAAFHKGKLYTCALGDTLAVTDLATNELTMLGKVSGGPNGLVVMNDHLVVTTNKGIYVLGLDGEEKSKVSTTYTPTCCATNGKALAVGSKPKLYIYTLSGTKLEQKHEADEHKVEIKAVAFHGAKLASGDTSREILLWEFDGAALKLNSGPGQMAFHTAAIRSLAFNASGTHLASGSVDTNVMVWDTANKANRMKYQGAHLGGVNCVAWTSDNEVISAGQDCAIRTFTVKA